MIDHALASIRLLEGGLMFRFTPLADPARLHGTSRLWMDAFDRTNHDSVVPARFRGPLLALFGEPIVCSSDADAAFSYLFEVTDGTGETRILTAHEGPFGPAFGGLIDHPLEIAAAEALLVLIEQTSPADFAAVLSAPEYESRITYGCQAGEGYWREEPE
jgi:hypothetical protein